eukprot:Amastigsp_a516816_32.p1 type:complete len:149 gc:universal Amastigsp_a516816_32:629-183(-)
MAAASTAAAAARTAVMHLRKLTLVFCEHSGSSVAARSFAANALPKIAATNSAIEFTAAVKAGRHPQLIGEYSNGARHSIGIKNLSEKAIAERLELLRNRAGYKVRTRDAINRVVRAAGGVSVQGVWGGVGPARDVYDPEAPRLRKMRT